MLLPTIQQVKNVLPILEPAQFNKLVYTIIGIKTKEQIKETVSIYNQLVMYTYEWLTHLKECLSEDQIRWLLGNVKENLKEFSCYLEDNFDNSQSTIRSFQLTIIDCKYAIWPGTEKFADLNKEEFITQLERPACTYVMGDLYAIFWTKQNWLKHLFNK